VADFTSVGVAIPVRNGERFLAAALASVLEQTAPITDVVVVDDGSADRTREVALAAGRPVRMLSQPPRGVAVARTRAAELVSAEVIVMLDADDLLTPHSVASRLAALAAQPEVDVVFGHIRSFAESDTDGRPVPLDEPRPAHVPGAMLVRRTAFLRVGPFGPDRRAEGLDWLLRAREAGLREYTVPEQVLWRRVHGGNASLEAHAPLTEFPRLLKASLDRRRARAEDGR
jgi:glycosyltransferase involved in cell wall biosynthesis